MSLPVLPIHRLDLSLVSWQWPFARDRRAEIDAHFTALLAHKPQMWNGRVLMTKDCRIDGGVLSGACFEADFASLLAWRDWGFPDRTVTNCFAMGALQASDGAFVLGVMGAHTANAGRIYFPAGTLEPADAVDGRVDLTASVRREIAEEVGLGPEEYVCEPGWHAVPTGARTPIVKLLRARERAAELCRRIRAHIAADRKAELSDVVVVRGADDFHADMPPYVTAYLDRMAR